MNGKSNIDIPEVSIVVDAADVHFEAKYYQGVWYVHCCNPVTGEKAAGTWNYQELGAVLWLLAGTGEEEGTDPELTQVMYATAEPLIRDWPAGVRPIP